MTVVTEDWTFAHLRRVETLWGPHGYHRYPAKFIPQLVSRLIELYSAPGDLVGDPFLGSATTGIEALRMGRRFWGSDISQVALLISRRSVSHLIRALYARHGSSLTPCLTVFLILAGDLFARKSKMSLLFTQSVDFLRWFHQGAEGLEILPGVYDVK